MFLDWRSEFRETSRESRKSDVLVVGALDGSEGRSRWVKIKRDAMKVDDYNGLYVTRYFV